MFCVVGDRLDDGLTEALTVHLACSGGLLIRSDWDSPRFAHRFLKRVRLAFHSNAFGFLIHSGLDLFLAALHLLTDLRTHSVAVRLDVGNLYIAVIVRSTGGVSVWEGSLRGVTCPWLHNGKANGQTSNDQERRDGPHGCRGLLLYRKGLRRFL